MVSHFDRWEKDPFFSAAEEVQESADRMESTYRTWLHSKKDTSGTWNPDEIKRDLRTALGTTKWQLEEFERAVKPSYVNRSSEDSKERHKEFIFAIESQISNIESSLHKSSVSDGKPPRPWVHLDEGERDELALFLSGPALSVDKTFVNVNMAEQSTLLLDPNSQSKQDCRKCSLNSSESIEDKPTGHRRTASASADIGAWKISVGDDMLFPQSSSNEHREPPPRKIPSLSGFLNKMDAPSKLKWVNNGYRKLKTKDPHQEADIPLSQPHELTRGINDCYERSKSFLDSCDDSYNKQLYGWYGSIQRMLQRSQYQLQYRQPLQVVFWIVLLVCSIGLFAFNAV